MSYFKRYRRMTSRMTVDLVGPRQLRYLLKSKPVVDTVAERWGRLHRHCADGGSRVRLERLFTRLGSIDPGVQESALAELELGTRLLEVGASVQFLPESEARSADLECRLGNERFFVEVTAMIGAVERARRLSLQFPTVRVGDEEPDREPGDVLTKAILARIHQKAKQLRDYCDPVVLAISVPNVDPCQEFPIWTAFRRVGYQHIGWFDQYSVAEAPALERSTVGTLECEPAGLSNQVYGWEMSVSSSGHGIRTHPRAYGC